MNKKTLVCFPIFIILISYFTGNTQVSAQDLMKAPDIQQQIKSTKPHFQTSTVKLVLKGTIGFYSNIISPADGPRSPSYPTGTAYGKQAIEKHGFIKGIVLIADRLIHESDVALGPKIILYGTTRYYDPIENNTFWWESNTEDTK